MPYVELPPPMDGSDRIVAPAHAPRHRRWRVFYDPGHFAHGMTTRETKWRAKAPDQVCVEADSYNDVLNLVDAAEDAAGLDRGERLPRIEHNPLRPGTVGGI
jgi:hypothetical protein